MLDLPAAFQYTRCHTKILKIMKKHIGERIRKARLAKGWSLRQLSEHCGLSVSFLSLVERGLSSLSIVSLSSICKALGLPLAELLTDRQFAGSDDLDPGHVTITPAGEHPIIQISNSDVLYHHLSGSFPGRQFEILINEFPPNYTQHPLAAHEGEEFGYVLEGHLTLWVRDQGYPLKPGDSYHFRATNPHRYCTLPDEGAKVLIVTNMKFLDWQSKRRKIHKIQSIRGGSREGQAKRWRQKIAS